MGKNRLLLRNLTCQTISSKVISSSLLLLRLFNIRKQRRRGLFCQTTWISPAFRSFADYCSKWLLLACATGRAQERQPHCQCVEDHQKDMCLAGQCWCVKTQRRCISGSLMQLGENSLELHQISSNGQMHSKPKFNHLFGADHVSMNNCQLLETNQTLLHFRVLIQPSWGKLVCQVFGWFRILLGFFSEENRKRPRNNTTG